MIQYFLEINGLTYNTNLIYYNDKGKAFTFKKFINEKENIR
jgi:hypothetical protein